ncbi:MAG TPA: peptide-methionine (S)-S-oxide reductase MsrA [Paenirhodobacter sp.]
MTLALSGLAAQAQEGVVIPAPAKDIAVTAAGLQTAVFAGGCFWGIQGVFQHVNGVTNAVSGYAGGSADTAHYQVVSSGTTGHAESVRITFDPAKISYGHLLQIFFSVAHDPTQLNRQGPDRGTQYRTAIFPQTDEQATVARAYIDQLNRARLYEAAIVTTIEPGRAFYPAEGYHQDYLTNNPTQPYIVYNDLPKVARLGQMFPMLYRATPVLVAQVGLGG